MKKKILASLLAAASMASLAASVSAADQTDMTNGVSETVPTDTNGGYSKSISASATVNVPTLNVTVPGSTVVKLNPYRITVELNGANTQDSILNQAMEFTNSSTCDVLVSVTATAEAAGSAVITKTAPTDSTIKSDTKKTVYLFLAAGKEAKKSNVIAATYATKASTDVNIIPFDGKQYSAVSIDKKDGGTAGKAYIKVGGYVNSNPKEAWTSSDTVAVNLVYNFAPAVAEVTVGS